jgi:antitoxin component YwqK of YwqJK toxin-antitoxin module
MRILICILALVFFISDCGADARILAQLRARSAHKAKSAAAKHKKTKKKIRQPSVTVKHKKTKEIPFKEIVTKEELDFRDNLAYLPNQDKPFSGKHEQYHPNGKRYVVTNYKDGKKNGILIMWDEYEHKVGQLSFMDGKLLE